MPIFGDAETEPGRGSAGPRTGFLDGISASFDQTFRVDSATALPQEVINRWNENLDALERQTGERYTRPAIDGMIKLIRARQGEDLMDPNLATSYVERQALINYPEQMRAAFETGTLAELTAQDAKFLEAGLPTFEQLFTEVTALQRQVEARSAEVSETGGTTGFLGQLLGGVAGSLTTRDPLTLATLPVGGVGKSVAMRLATEAGAAAAVETALQFGAVADNRRLAGLPEADKLQNILFAAGGATVLRGLFDGVGAGARVLARRNAPQDIAIDFEDAQLRQFLGERPDDPRARAALDILDEEDALAAASPYGTSYPALRRFNAEVAEAEMALLGRSDTAIGRVLPQDAAPLPVREREADFVIVREQAPEVAARYDAAEARLAEIDGQVDAIEAEVSGRTVLDAVRLVDEDAARELEQLAARTDIPEEAKSLEADLIFNRVSKPRILKAAEDAEIAPRKQTQRLRAQRRAANKEYRAALKAMEAERVKLTTAADRVKAMMAGESKDLLGYAIATRPMQGSALSREVVSQKRTLILEGAEDIADNAPVPLVREDGMIEIGDTAIPANFRLLNEAGEPVELAAVLRDLDEEDRLAEAMGSCSI